MPDAPHRPIGSRSLALHPHVSVRAEPFGGLVYHHDSRRLVMLRHPDVVTVITTLEQHPNVDETLRACDIDEHRFASFHTALASLLDSGVLSDRGAR